MDTVDIRQKLHQFIDRIADKKAEAIYTLFEEEIETDEWEYTDAFKEELDERQQFYENGGELISADEANAQIKALLQSDFKNK